MILTPERKRALMTPSGRQLTPPGQQTGPISPIAVYKLDSQLTNPLTGTPAIPWQQLLIGLATSLVPEAPQDGRQYVRQNGAWVPIVSP